MNVRLSLLYAVVLSVLPACTDASRLESDLDRLSGKLDALESLVQEANRNAIALHRFTKENLLIVGMEKLDYGYELALNDGTTVTVIYGKEAPAVIPILSIEADGVWTMSLDGGRTFSPIQGAANAGQGAGSTPLIRTDADKYWQISLDGGRTWQRIKNADGKDISASDGSSLTGKTSVFADVRYDSAKGDLTFTLSGGREIHVPVLETFFLQVMGFKDGALIHLGETMVYEITASDVDDAMIRTPEGWAMTLTDKSLTVTGPASGKAGRYETSIVLVSSKGYLKKISLAFTLNPVELNATGCKPWDNFAAGNDANLLPDFSFAGYDHGLSAPPDAWSLGYQIFNIKDYGAIPNDGKSDREAFLKAYQAAIGGGTVEQNPSAKAILYIPEGEYILHTAADDADGKSSPLTLRAGDFILKGAGRDKTTLLMQDPNLPASAALYSSPVMIDLKHYSGLKELTSVTENASKGSFQVVVASTGGLSEGEWICLTLKNNDPGLIAEELSPYSVEPGMKDLLNEGVKVFEYHQIASISGNTLTFEEPLLHAVASKWKWKICKYPHYERVGVEDITFKGNAKPDFKHHGSWQDDGAYKLVNMTRIVNGWMRRVRFTSVSEASSLTNCANLSVYDVLIDGNRGHSSIRSQASTRVFIGKVIDRSSGIDADTGVWTEGAGQYHATGVSKPSIGTVLWRNQWGTDACFEAHATQPRATLIDCCTGGWIQYRQGGDETQVPNHLSDLILWNFESVSAFWGNWGWWSSGKWWKFLPPVIVGFHGQGCAFDPSQVKLNADYGTTVDPESLYEAQLRHRTGVVPAWLQSIK